MKIEFEFDIDDWMEFQKHYLNNSKQFKRVKIIFTALLPCVLACFIISSIIEGQFNVITLIVYFIVSILWIIIFPKRMSKRQLKSVKKIITDGDNLGLLGMHEYIFNEDHIFIKKLESEQKMYWSGIKKVKENDSYYFLYDSALSAIVLPKQKIKNVEELDMILKKHLSF